eukprot:CAMPEP_0203849730 /NCGR_PEP_ID=MMETSP0359-20131031/6356_1 /ASSEMBLY_ACC=CAM_ASM_000338 /TAXON_ID=268821 /ORGANISM="Scrippsiella Hangoei, Strain SHTV-5" /LENGTH=58 /DNA_ID=CAMNT_0050765519 /DNA_START=45 /DNA_END=217 /DNA_ORIENTATION=+
MAQPSSCLEMPSANNPASKAQSTFGFPSKGRVTASGASQRAPSAEALSTREKLSLPVA